MKQKHIYKIIIENPRFCTPAIKVPLENIMTREQVIRNIEKAIMQKNILADKIFVE